MDSLESTDRGKEKFVGMMDIGRDVCQGAAEDVSEGALVARL